MLGLSAVVVPLLQQLLRFVLTVSSAHQSEEGLCWVQCNGCALLQQLLLFVRRSAVHIRVKKVYAEFSAVVVPLLQQLL